MDAKMTGLEGGKPPAKFFRRFPTVPPSERIVRGKQEKLFVTLVSLLLCAVE